MERWQKEAIVGVRAQLQEMSYGGRLEATSVRTSPSHFLSILTKVAITTELELLFQYFSPLVTADTLQLFVRVTP